MKKRMFTFLVGLLTMGLTGCSLDSEENFQFVTLEVVSANMPETLTFNTVHDIEVILKRPDNCTFFHRFDISSSNANQRDIVAFGSMLLEDECESVEEEITALMEFTPVEIGSYQFRFYTGQSAEGEPQFIEYVVPIKPAEVD